MASTTSAAASNYVNAGRPFAGRAIVWERATPSTTTCSRDTFIQQRYTTYYNSQCCGVAIEYQTFNYGGSLAAYGLTQDKRFNLSFTLAGIGTFSNLFGAFGGQQGGR